VGLLHISKMKERVRDATKKFKVGQTLKVKVVEIDEQGRPKFTDNV